MTVLVLAMGSGQASATVAHDDSAAISTTERGEGSGGYGERGAPPRLPAFVLPPDVPVLPFILSRWPVYVPGPPLVPPSFGD